MLWPWTLASQGLQDMYELLSFTNWCLGWYSALRLSE